MTEREVCTKLRKEFNKTGWALLIYYGIMNSVVSLICVADALFRTFPLALQDFTWFESEFIYALTDSLTTNGWGYIVTMIIGALLMLVWKKREFCVVKIWKNQKPMRLKDFCALLCVFISGQALFQVLVIGLEMVFNQFGGSVMDFVSSATGVEDTVSMFLYACLFAPVGEEILFRGLILRTMEPYGKKFAILVSAILFGVFHGNLVQTPYAFAVGLVLGYTAVEYSIVWAMLLHMINNLVLADTFNRIAMFLPEMLGEILFLVIIWGCTLLALIILICRRKEVIEYFRNGRIHPWPLKAFFTSPGIWTFVLILMSNIALTIILG